MDSSWNFTPAVSALNNAFPFDPLLTPVDIPAGSSLRIDGICGLLHPEQLLFQPVTAANISLVWHYLQREPGRTTDFSYGGVLMWADYYRYEYSIVRDTLFLRGVSEADLSRPVYALPVGDLLLSDSVELLRLHCARRGERLLLSCVPEYALDQLLPLQPRSVVETPDTADYLYDLNTLATLSGKKMGKKRNHVNKFVNTFPVHRLDDLRNVDPGELERFMDLYDTQRDSTALAVAESYMTRCMLRRLVAGDPMIEGGALRAGERLAAFTIADRKGDTLFIHIEKADRDIPGSYEMINQAFAMRMMQEHPGLRYVNREDAAGDEGLRRAKESYHPVELLRKYDVEF